MRRAALVVFAVAASLRTIHVLAVEGSLFGRALVGDGRAYDAWAREIAAGDWLGAGVFYQAPLYPYFLAVLHAILEDAVSAARWVQVLLGSLACVAVAVAGRTFFSPRAGLVAGLLLATYPPSIYFDGLVQKTVLDAGLVAALLAVLARFEDLPAGRTALLAGAVLGLLGLTRENALLIALPLAAWFARRGLPIGPGRSVLLFALGAAVVILPVGLRNARTGGEFTLTTSQLGPNFYIGNHAGATGFYAPLREGRGDARYERADAETLAEEARGRSLSPREISDYWLEKALGDIGRDPLAWGRLLARKTLWSWNAAERADTESIEAYTDVSPLLRVLSIWNFGTLATLAFAGALLTISAWRRIWILHAITASLMLGLVVFFVFARYRQPAVPVLVLFAGTALCAVPEALRSLRERRRPSARTIAGAVAVAAFAAFVFFPFREHPQQRARGYHSLAASLLEEGRKDEAVRCLDRALAAWPDHLASIGKLAKIRLDEGRANDAAPLLQRVVSARPNDVAARRDLGLALFESGRAAEAVEQFRRGAELSPGDADLWTNLGAALVAADRPAEAVPALERALSIAPEAMTARLNLGAALLLTGRSADAEALLRAVLAREPTNGRARFLLEQARASAR